MLPSPISNQSPVSHIPISSPLKFTPHKIIFFFFVNLIGVKGWHGFIALIIINSESLVKLSSHQIYSSGSPNHKGVSFPTPNTHTHLALQFCLPSHFENLDSRLKTPFTLESDEDKITEIVLPKGFD